MALRCLELLVGSICGITGRLPGGFSGLQAVFCGNTGTWDFQSTTNTTFWGGSPAHVKFSRPTTSTAAIKYSRVLADYKHTLLWQRKLPMCTTSTSCPLVNVSPGFPVLTDCMTTTTRSRGSRARLEVPRPTMTHHHHHYPTTPPPPPPPPSSLWYRPPCADLLSF